MLNVTLSIQCEAIRSEPFSYEQHAQTVSKQKTEYGQVGVFRIKMKSLGQKLQPLEKCQFSSCCHLIASHCIVLSPIVNLFFPTYLWSAHGTSNYANKLIQFSNLHFNSTYLYLIYIIATKWFIPNCIERLVKCALTSDTQPQLRQYMNFCT